MRVTLLSGCSLLLASVAEAHSSPSLQHQHADLVKRASVTCQSNEYKLNNKCYPCSSFSGAATCNSKEATSCLEGLYLHVGTCVEPSACGLKWYADEPTMTCKRCSDLSALTCTATESLSCTGKFLSGGKCLTQYLCPSGTFPDSRTYRCMPCSDPKADKCTRSTTISCLSGSLKDGRCVDDCGDGFSPQTPEGSTSSVCTACALTKGGKCVAECGERFFATGLTCSACSDGAISCESATVATACGTNAENVPTFLESVTSSCVIASQCPSASYADSKTSKCTTCAQGALKCDKDGLATACEAGLYLTGAGNCVLAKDCPVSTYPQSATALAPRRRALSAVSVCQTCRDDGAISCSSTRSLTCGKDKSGAATFLLNGRCVRASTCPDWSFADATTSTCRRCSTIAPGSSTCDALGATSCGSDAAGLQLFLTPNRNCVLPASCPVSTFPNEANGKAECSPCDPGTTACTGSGKGNALSCGRTEQSLSLFFDADAKFCVEQCPRAFYAQTASSLCVACDEGESACTGNGDGDALACGTNSKGIQTFLNPSQDCVVAEKCPAAYFADKDSATCRQCDAGEAACEFAGPGGATACAKNANNVQLYLDLAGECVVAEDCPVSTFVNEAKNECSPCADGALLCTSPTDASLCGLDKAGRQTYLDDGLCVKTCSAGRWGDDERFVCRECSIVDKDAKTCSPADALSCKSLFVYHGDCVAKAECGTSTFIDTSVRSCTDCSLIVFSSATCTKTQALTCLPGSFLLDGKCLSSCPSAYFTNAATNVCDSCATRDPLAATCTATKSLTCAQSFLQGDVCVKSCATGSFADPVSKACVSCTTFHASALTCSAAQVFSCSKPFVPDQQTCVPGTISRVARRRVTPAGRQLGSTAATTEGECYAYCNSRDWEQYVLFIAQYRTDLQGSDRCQCFTSIPANADFDDVNSNAIYTFTFKVLSCPYTAWHHGTCEAVTYDGGICRRSNGLPCV